MFVLNSYVRSSKVLRRMFALFVPYYEIIRTDIWTVRIDLLTP